ncbi:MAG: biopolymer transporter ExbD [Gammaproteobacteria bacterium]
MALQTRSEQQAMSEINVTPLVDVMLVLLVIFIVTAPLMTRAVHVELPETAATTPVEQSQHVHVSMDAQGMPFIENRPVTLEELEAELHAQLDADPGLTVQVHGDAQTAYGRMALMMSLIQRAGVTKVDLVTLPMQ